MAVQVHDQNFGIDGHGKTIAVFRRAHLENSDSLVNHMEGKPIDAPRPVYDPDHPDNKWPLMVHHPAKGELTVGKSLKGVDDPKVRTQIEADNAKKLKAALDSGYRLEPYIKPQVAVLDPASEKAAMLKRNQELEGQLIAQHDRLNRLEELITKPAA